MSTYVAIAVGCTECGRPMKAIACTVGDDAKERAEAIAETWKPGQQDIPPRCCTVVVLPVGLTAEAIDTAE